jgi:hypothetical protein
MGCGILYRMVVEQIGLRATLATRRMGSVCLACIGVGVEPLTRQLALRAPGPW